MQPNSEDFILNVDCSCENLSSDPTSCKMHPQSQCKGPIPISLDLWSPLEKLVSNFKQLSHLQIIFLQAFIGQKIFTKGQILNAYITSFLDLKSIGILAKINILNIIQQG